MSQRAIDGEYIYFVTANVQSRRWYFTVPIRAEILGQAMRTCCMLKHFDLLAYCILPNHVHILVRKLSDREALQRQRALERARCDGEEDPSVPSSPDRSPQPPRSFLFTHRRLSSRRPPYTLSDLMKSIKGSFSRTLPKGTFWQHRSNFRIIETDRRLYNTINYMIYNYKKMALPDAYGQPPFVFINDEAVCRASR